MAKKIANKVIIDKEASRIFERTNLSSVNATMSETNEIVAQ